MTTKSNTTDAFSAALASAPAITDIAQLDLAALRLPQTFGAVAGVKKVLTTVPCRKPNSQSFVRVHAGEDWRMPVAILQLKDDGECYLVVPDLVPELLQEVRSKMLYAAITRDGNPFLWPVNRHDEEGRLDSWSQSAHCAAQLAEHRWVRLVANRTTGAYDVMEASQLAEEPAWGEQSFRDLVNLAFRDKLISSMEHPVVMRLKGLV